MFHRGGGRPDVWVPGRLLILPRLSTDTTGLWGVGHHARQRCTDVLNDFILLRNLLSRLQFTHHDSFPAVLCLTSTRKTRDSAIANTLRIQYVDGIYSNS